MHREVTRLAFKSTKLALGAKFLILSLGLFLCPRRILLGLHFGVTVAPYSRRLVRGGHTQGRQYRTGSRAPALLTAAQGPWKNRGGGGTQRVPRLPPEHPVVKRKIQNQVEMFSHFRPSDTRSVFLPM